MLLSYNNYSTPIHLGDNSHPVHLSLQMRISFQSVKRFLVYLSYGRNPREYPMANVPSVPDLTT